MAATPTTGSWSITDNVRADAFVHHDIDFARDSFAVMLFDRAVPASADHCSTIPGEISSVGTGYPRGGTAVTVASTAEGRRTKLYFGGEQPSFNAGIAGIEAKTAVLCDRSTDYVVAWVSLARNGSDVTTTPGNQMTLSDTVDNPILVMSP